MAEEIYEAPAYEEDIDSIYASVLAGDAFKNADKWVIHRTRDLIRALDEAEIFSGMDPDLVALYISAFISGYAARLDGDYSSKDTVVGTDVIGQELTEHLVGILSGYSAPIKARTIHFIVENFPGEDNYADPEFMALASYIAVGFSSGFVCANEGPEDDEVKVKMNAKGLSDEQCLSAANGACAQFKISKDAVAALGRRIKELADHELYPRSGVKRGYPISMAQIDIIRLYSMGYAAGVLHALDIRDGKIAINTKQFALPDYVKMAERLWKTWGYRHQHTVEAKRAAKAGWTFYLNKENGAIIDTPEKIENMEGKDAKAMMKLLNNVYAYEFMRGWSDGFSDTFYGTEG